jgi:hypothetical protein
MSEPDLNQPATVHLDALSETEWVGEPQTFSSLKQAVLYVMFELPADVRTYAWITSETVQLPRYEDIEAFYVEYMA